MQRPGNDDIQLDPFLDYRNPVPKPGVFQGCTGARRGTGASTIRFSSRLGPTPETDNPNAVVELLDTGHFAFETHAEHIAQRISGGAATG